MYTFIRLTARSIIPKRVTDDGQTCNADNFACFCVFSQDMTSKRLQQESALETICLSRCLHSEHFLLWEDKIADRRIQFL